MNAFVLGRGTASHRWPWLQRAGAGEARWSKGKHQESATVLLHKSVHGNEQHQAERGLISSAEILLGSATRQQRARAEVL